MSDVGGRLHVRMRARDIAEPHRASTPLELLFDLVFVVAIAQLAVQLAIAIEHGDALVKLGPFCFVLFAVWWAWMNFTWFASAFDTDDALYRVFTVIQMAGALILAAGVPAAFEDVNFVAVTIGYLVMRIGLVAHWIRAGIEHEESRVVAFRYAGAIIVVQAGWVLRLLIPDPGILLASSLFLGVVDLLTPVWAERKGATNWHPHHIAERYGLFVIILLGEGVLAAATALQATLRESGLSGPLVVVGFGGLVIVVALWWIYFLEPAGEALQRRRSWSYWWGYGHYFVFAALAAVASGLEVALAGSAHHLEIDDTQIGLALGIPIAVFLLMLWVVHAPLVERNVVPLTAIVPAAALVLLLPFAAPVLGVAGVTVGMALVLSVLVVAAELLERAPVTSH